MKHTMKIILPSFAAALLDLGCVSIPMGTETFTTKYSTEVVPSERPPIEASEPILSLSENDGDHKSVTIGLAASITREQAQEQRQESVTLVKSKYMSFGFFPHGGGIWTKNANALSRQSLPYQGDGRYATFKLNSQPREKPHGSFASWNMGAGGNGEFFAILNTPFSLLFGAFGPYESDKHVSGRFIGTEKKIFDSGASYTERTYRGEDIELLLKFPMSDRERIGAWTYHEDASHPHNTFRNSFGGASLFGFHKWAQYEIKTPEALPSIPAMPKMTTVQRAVNGPYSVCLSIPDIGFYQTSDVGIGETEVSFNLVDAANGASSANGIVQFLPPPGGLGAISNKEDRSILELAVGREWPVKVALPAPRLGNSVAVATDMAESLAETSSPPFYRIVGVENNAAGEMVVRIRVDDTSRTFEIDRQVQPEIKRLFREQSGETDWTRTISVRWATEDGGKTLVYTVGFHQ